MKNIAIYTTPTCHFCHGAKEFFKKYNIAYTEKDVTKDTAARNEMVAKSGGMSVPVIDIDSQIVVGFDEAELRKLLDIKS